MFFRLRDGEKTLFEPFFADRTRLQELSDAIGNTLPIALAGLPDILGDIIIQLPVTLVLPRIEASGGAEKAHLSVLWRSDAAARALTVAGRNRSDRLLTSATFGQGFSQDIDLGLDIHRNETETEIWDTETGILVSATAATSTVKAFTLNFHIGQPEPRVFSLPIVDGVPMSARVAIASMDRRESRPENQRDRWLSRRQDIEEKRLLDANRDFVQYLPKPGSPDERARALADIRYLINRHGSEGVDLWDPYLTGGDILSTLFYCKWAEAPLRAITGVRDAPVRRPDDVQASESIAGPVWPFLYRERWVLEQNAGNREGLKLEYRARQGSAGWTFHDRFLLFPNGPGGPLAWSLGTSVNSLGSAHHILQRVSNPALIVDAFSDLWQALSGPDQLVWRSK